MSAQPSYQAARRLSFLTPRGSYCLLIVLSPLATLISAQGNGVGLCGDATRQGIPGSGRVNGPHGPGGLVAGIVVLPLKFCKSEISANPVHDRPSRTLWVLRGLLSVQTPEHDRFAKLQLLLPFTCPVHSCENPTVPSLSAFHPLDSVPSMPFGCGRGKRGRDGNSCR